ncbi:hypothetical protein [Streptomyces sp. NPDC021096]|uniref:hypothetical protein n=1 Tax=Streptomyces sp. NPDC021096 TaxID=3154792 RepID=UPI0033DE9418
MREEWYYRRGHWVRKPNRSRSDGNSPWIALAVVAVLVWGMLNSCLNDDASDEPAPKPPASSTALR